MLYTVKSEPPEVGLVKKLTGVCIGGWSSACQPYIESATALSDLIISAGKNSCTSKIEIVVTIIESSILVTIFLEGGN